MTLKLYSRSCEYAIRALASIGGDGRGKSFSLRELCKKAGVPEPITRKSFQTLVRKGVLSAKRGCGGGYRFRRSPANVTLMDIIQAVDGKRPYDRCILGHDTCGHPDPCELHEIWEKARTTLVSELSSSSLAQLMGKHEIKTTSP